MQFDGMSSKRCRDLEEEFFYRVNQELIQKLRSKAETRKGRERLAQVTGITDQCLLDELLDAGIHAETLVALALVPLIHLAWADGVVDPNERAAILKAAAAAGIGRETVSFQLLSKWLRHGPRPGVFVAWRKYTAAMKRLLEPEKLQELKEDIARRARGIAAQSSSILGIKTIPEAKASVLKEIEGAFDG